MLVTSLPIEDLTLAMEMMTMKAMMAMMTVMTMMTITGNHDNHDKKLSCYKKSSSNTTLSGSNKLSCDKILSSDKK